MDFKFVCGQPIELESSNEATNDKRWTLMLPEHMEQNYAEKYRWFYGVMKRTDERTKLFLAHDKQVKRPAIAKVVEYRIDEIQSEKAILDKRNVLTEQLRMLNDLNTPLLPEPLDWFTVTNEVNGLPLHLSNQEPVLMLDYIPGRVLSWYIDEGKFRYDRNNELNIPKLARVAVYILEFLRILDNKGYAYVGLTPEHVILLNDEIPRFVGLGRICKLDENGLIDENHINADRTVAGFSAPERNDYVGFSLRNRASGRQVGAFGLGVILHQMIYGSSEIPVSMMKKGSFYYPNGKSEYEILESNKGKNEKKIKIADELIAKLCHHDPNKRLCNYDVIEEKLNILCGNGIIKKKEVKRKYNNRQYGVIKWFNIKDKYGYLSCENGEEYRFTSNSIKYLKQEDVEKLCKDIKVSFEIFIRKEDGKIFINNLRPESDGQDIDIKNSNVDMPHKNRENNNLKRETSEYKNNEHDENTELYGWKGIYAPKLIKSSLDISKLIEYKEYTEVIYFEGEVYSRGNNYFGINCKGNLIKIPFPAKIIEPQSMPKKLSLEEYNLYIDKKGTAFRLIAYDFEKRKFITSIAGTYDIHDVFINFVETNIKYEKLYITLKKPYRNIWINGVKDHSASSQKNMLNILTELIKKGLPISIFDLEECEVQTIITNIKNNSNAGENSREKGLLRNIMNYFNMKKE